MRLDKFLSQLKYGSRSQIKKDIKKGMITVNQVLIKDEAFDVFPTKDQVTYQGNLIMYQEEIHLMMYKPKGYLSAHKDAMHPVVFELLKEPYHRFDYTIAGRLDLDSEGLLILTTSGALAHEIMSPRHHMTKRYQVLLDHSFSHEKMLLNGVTIKDGKQKEYLAKASFVKTDGVHVVLDIQEGKFHQVKRMFKACGYEVLNLKRTQVGRLKLGALEPGAYIEIKKEDIYD